MANPAQVARFFEGARPRRRAHRPLPQHARAGPGERAGRARRGRALVRVVVRRAGRLPGAAGRDRQHRQRGPRLDAPRDGRGHRHRPRAPGRVRARGAARAGAAAGEPRADRGAGGLAQELRDDIEALAAMRARLGHARRARLGAVGGGAAAPAGRRGRRGSSRSATRAPSRTRRRPISGVGLLAALGRRRLLAAAALASFELEYSGRAQWLRRLLPARRGHERVARLPARGERRAHARARRAPRRRTHRPHVGPAAEPAGDRAAARTGKRASLALLPSWPSPAAALGLRRLPAAMLGARGRAVTRSGAQPGRAGRERQRLRRGRRARAGRPARARAARRARGRGAGAAAARSPAWAGWRPGCATEGRRSTRERTLVLGLDTIGSGEPVVLEAEGGLWPVALPREDVGVGRARRGLRRRRLGALDRTRARLIGGDPGAVDPERPRTAAFRTTTCRPTSRERRHRLRRGLRGRGRGDRRAAFSRARLLAIGVGGDDGAAGLPGRVARAADPRRPRCKRRRGGGGRDGLLRGGRARAPAPGGRFAERVGRCPRCAAAWWRPRSASCCVGAGGRSLAELLAVLAVAGVANSVNQPAINLFMADQVPIDRPGLAFGIKQSAIPRRC